MKSGDNIQTYFFPFQRCASSLFHTLIKLDADVVWLTLARVVRPASLVHDVHLPAPDDGYAHYAAPLLALAEATGPVWAPLA